MRRDAGQLLWRPLSAPQAKFVASTEFEVLYGGAKGGAKTESLVIAPLQQIAHPRFKGLLLREKWDELKEIHARCKTYYSAVGATFHGGDSQWRFPSGAFVEIGYLEDDADLKRYQGREWTFVGFDELGNLKDELTWAKMLAEIRSPDPALIRMARGTANPGGKAHAWLKQRMIVATDRGRTVARDPTTGLARRFIPSKVTDNPIYANDAQYMAVLRGLPDTQRRQLLDGDWDAGEGMALDELSRAVHLIPPRAVPDWWYQWGALDIGFGHCWCFAWAAMSPDGRAYVCDSLHGQRDRYDEVARRIVEQVPPAVLANVVCDNYARQEGSRGHRDRTPSVMELFSEYGIMMAEANQRRVLGLNNLRLWLGWRLADGKTKTPRLRFFDTPGNRLTFDCLERMVVDPKNVEDVLKVHADAQGRGGDDPYDTVRYLMAAHPYTPNEPVTPDPVGPDRDPAHWLPRDPDDTDPDDPNPETIGGLSYGF